MGAGTVKTTTEMKLVPVSKLVPYVNNARTHSPEQIAKLRSSLREFGFINPIIIDKDYGVIAGHGRLVAAKEEGYTEVPCVFADHLSEAQKKAYIIADNRMAMDAGWDEELLRVEIESLQAADFDPLLTGFDEKELAKLFEEPKEVHDDDFDLTDRRAWQVLCDRFRAHGIRPLVVEPLPNCLHDHIKTGDDGLELNCRVL